MILTYSGVINRADFVAEMIAHRAADRLAKGTYSSSSYDSGSAHKWHGCAVGCGVRTIRQRTGNTALHFSDHAGLADALGWPEWLVRLEDVVFEGLAPAAALAWPARLAQAVPEGCDLAPALDRFLVRLLREIVLRDAIHDTDAKAAAWAKIADILCEEVAKIQEAT